MSGIGSRETLTPIIREIINDETGRGGSVIMPPEGGNTVSRNVDPRHSPVKEPETVIAGTGKAANGFVFTKQPDAFVPALVGNKASTVLTSPSPTKVRRATVTSTYYQGYDGENISNVVVWAPPLVDVTGRWLERITNDPVVGTQFNDTLAYYMVDRENVTTGEVVTVGMVGHSAQVVTGIREFLEAEKVAGRAGAVTDKDNWRATIDAALYLGVVDSNGDPVLDDQNQQVMDLIIPDGHEVYFQCQDTTAIRGQQYRYLIRAINANQLEGQSVWVVPGASTAAAGLSLNFAPGWCATYPNIYAGDTTGGNGAYLDLTLQAGGLISDAEVSIIPLMDSAMDIDTTAPPLTDPYMVESNPLEIKLYAPTASYGVNIIEFVGRNIESCGGISGVTGGTGITLDPAAIYKSAISGSSTDYLYRIKLRVQTGTPVGPKTLTFTCTSGKTFLASQFTVVVGDPPSTVGAEFDKPGESYKFSLTDPMAVTITGKRMGTITGWTVTPAGKTTITLVSQSENAISFSFTAFTGTATIKPTLTEGYSSSAKDTAVLFRSEDSGGDTSDPSDFTSGDSSRNTITIRQVN